ncbi:MAG: hypothetical protein EZS28_002159 [Streblomastix strix]|uniref:Uncharacterized protein n=1 Tax=Streblomastix strix TaxID=222440 RepID=A0A5J4X4Z4_9EUKA|nr:MAG: hypothetical protein EZS28_002159 [Streblomastix strix]
MSSEIYQLLSSSNEKELGVYALSYSETRWIGLFLAARWIYIHKNQIMSARLTTSIHSINFAVIFYIITKPLFETVSFFESNKTPVSLVFPLAQFILLYLSQLLQSVIKAEPWKSFVQTLCNYIYFYYFVGDNADLYATSFALSFAGQKLMQTCGNIGIVRPTDRNVRLQYGVPNYLDESFPTEIPAIDLKSLPLKDKSNNNSEYKILTAKINDSIRCTRQLLKLDTNESDCSRFVQLINWRQRCISYIGRVELTMYNSEISEYAKIKHQQNQAQINQFTSRFTIKLTKKNYEDPCTDHTFANSFYMLYNCNFSNMKLNDVFTNEQFDSQTQVTQPYSIIDPWIAQEQNANHTSSITVDPWRVQTPHQEIQVTSPMNDINSQMVKDIQNDQAVKIQNERAISEVSTPLPLQKISGQTGIRSPTATFLTGSPEKLVSGKPVAVPQILDENEKTLASYFQAEAYDFFNGNYCGIEDVILQTRPNTYWSSIPKTDLMKKSFADFNRRLLAFTATEAGCERVFSDAKRILGHCRTNMSLQTIFCHLI